MFGMYAEYCKPILKFNGGHIAAYVKMPKGTSFSFKATSASKQFGFNNSHAVLSVGELLRTTTTEEGHKFERVIPTGSRMAEHTVEEWESQYPILSNAKDVVVTFTTLSDAEFVCISHGTNDPRNQVKVEKIILKQGETLEVNPISYLCFWETHKVKSEENVLGKYFYAVKNTKQLTAIEDTYFYIFTDI